MEKQNDINKYFPLSLNSKTFVSRVDMKRELEALGFSIYEIEKDPRTVIPGIVTEIRYDFYAKMKTAIQVINPVVLQQDTGLEWRIKI